MTHKTFAVWDKDRKEYRHDLLMDSYGKLWLINIQCYAIWQDGYEIVWYIGAKDISGKDIHEGHILRWYGMDLQEGASIVAVVKLGHMGAYFERIVPDVLDGKYVQFHKPQEAEIIGTVHENPELLKELANGNK